MSVFKDFRPLGAYDCLINTILFWMQRLEVSDRPFSQYNWDFYASSTTPLFGATIHLTAIQNVLERHYAIMLQEVDLASLTEETFILAVDAFHLPYIEEFYSIKQQPHFVLASKSRKENTYQIWDPYYNVQLDLPMAIVQKSALLSGKPSYRLYPISHVKAAPRVTAPYMLETDYVARYRSAFSRIAEVTGAIRYSTQPIKGSDLFKKCFSCIRGITKARERYFSSFQEDDLHDMVADQRIEVVSKWLAVEKSSIRMAMDFKNGYALFLTALETAIERDIRYLERWQIKFGA